MRKTLLLLSLVGALFAQGNNRRTILFPTLTAAGTTTGVNVGLGAQKHTVQVAVTGSPAGCSVQLEGTLDDAQATTPTWANISGAQTCTSSVTFHITDRPILGVRVNLTALTGGASPTVKVTYLGIQ